jgi:hypothetical protein
MAAAGEQQVTGVIFQFSAEAVLFEFSAAGEGGEELQIGMVKPSALRVGSR